MRKSIFATSVVLLLVGTFFVWRVIQHYTIPETPRTVITIPEGWGVEEINELLKKEEVLVEGELSLELEGYLFPDTYEFFLSSSQEVVEQKFAENFDFYLKELGVSPQRSNLNEIITMASLLEKEVQGIKEKRIASGILWKRLESGIALQVDATLCYIKEAQECLPITASDKRIDSQYNTYLYRGLPPGPISNPGADSILASVRPAASSYWYYLSDQVTGETIFARTLDEHNQNIVKYLNE